MRGFCIVAIIVGSEGRVIAILLWCFEPLLIARTREQQESLLHSVFLISEQQIRDRNLGEFHLITVCMSYL